MQDLSTAPLNSNFCSDLNVAVEEGLMDFDSSGMVYRFAHDKIREGAYEMIQEEKDRFHFDLGMILLDRRVDRMGQDSYSLFTILDQVNHGVPSLLRGESERISISKLNYEAGLEAMHGCNFTASYQYSSACISLLPSDSWEQYHDLCLKTYCLHSKSAFSNRKFEEAKVCNFVI